MESSSLEGVQPRVLTSNDGTPAAPGVARWGRRLALGAGTQMHVAPQLAGLRTLLDIAVKREMQWLVTELAWIADGDGRGAPAFRDELGFLLRRAPCPVLCVPPWAAGSEARARVAVVGVDRSEEARAAAHAAASLLTRESAPARLILVHGSSAHPAELSRRTPWRELELAMAPDRHAWIFELARELQGASLPVEAVVALCHAPDLIGGIARRAHADFAALGIAPRSEAETARFGGLHEAVVRSVACPLLTCSVSA